MSLDTKLNIDRHPKLPHRFTERAFRNYEAVIATVITNWPSATAFSPTKSLETFTQRLRDAVRSYKEMNWASELIKRDKFLSAYDYIMVRATLQGTVIVCHRDERPHLTAAKVEVVPFDHSRTGSNIIRNPNIEQVRAHAVLLESRTLESVEFADVKPDAEKFILSLESQYDVVVEKKENGNYKIV